EYEEGQTAEAKFVKDLDRFEMEQCEVNLLGTIDCCPHDKETCVVIKDDDSSPSSRDQQISGAALSLPSVRFPSWNSTTITSGILMHPLLDR
ncbi:hypothetical protein AX14_005867, partial [Amanita brunnescens Koide BX004]